MFNIGDKVIRSKKHYDAYWQRVCKNNKVRMDAEFIVKKEGEETITIAFGPYDNLSVYKNKFELVHFELENE